MPGALGALAALGALFMQLRFSQTIPKDWAELNSSCKLQVRAAGKVKKPTGKRKEMALRGMSSHEFPTAIIV